MGEARAPPAAARISLLLPSPLPSLAPAPFPFPHRDGGAGPGRLAPGRAPEARSAAANPPSLLFPFAALFKDPCPARRGLSLLQVNPVVVEGELLPLTAAVLRARHPPPRRWERAAAKGCRPAAASASGGRQHQRVRRKKIESKKTVSGRGEDGGRLQLEPLATAQPFVRSHSGARHAHR